MDIVNNAVISFVILAVALLPAWFAFKVDGVRLSAAER
jgi:hypothetical protein